ncbi:MAG: hypothetical protein KIT74_09640 [Fimbriimonadales bacterium]|nr:hypothetical protein [Fimbriimonadales bacterium]
MTKIQMAVHEEVSIERDFDGTVLRLRIAAITTLPSGNPVVFLQAEHPIAVVTDYQNEVFETFEWFGATARFPALHFGVPTEDGYPINLAAYRSDPTREDYEKSVRIELGLAILRKTPREDELHNGSSV